MSTCPGTGSSRPRCIAPGRARCRGSSPATACGRRARRSRRGRTRPSALTTSTAMPSDGAPTEHSLIGIAADGERKQVPTSVPPEMLMIGRRPSPTTVENQRYGSGFHGSPLEARIRRVERSWLAHRLLAVRHEDADESRRDAEHGDAMALALAPEAVGRHGGESLTGDDRRPVDAAADHHSHRDHPAEVGDPVQAVALTDVGLERALLADLHEQAGSRVHHSLRAAGRARRVDEAVRVLGVERLALALTGLAGDEVVPTHVPVGRDRAPRLVRRTAPGRSRARPTGESTSAASSVSLSRCTWPRRSAPSAVITAFTSPSTRRAEIAFAARPEKSGTCTAPISAQACVAITPSASIGR